MVYSNAQPTNELASLVELKVRSQIWLPNKTNTFANRTSKVTPHFISCVHLESAAFGQTFVFSSDLNSKSLATTRTTTNTASRQYQQPEGEDLGLNAGQGLKLQSVPADARRRPITSIVRSATISLGIPAACAQ